MLKKIILKEEFQLSFSANDSLQFYGTLSRESYYQRLMLSDDTIIWRYQPQSAHYFDCNYAQSKLLEQIYQECQKEI